MKDCDLPTRKECLAILAEYHVPPHVVSHSRKVAKLAVFLAQKLNENGAAIDVALLEGAGLLHDMLRIHDFKESDYNQFEQNLPIEEKPKWRRLRTRYKASSQPLARPLWCSKERLLFLVSVIARSQLNAIDCRAPPTGR